MIHAGGLIILEGEKADESTIELASPAFMCRSVADTALLLNVLVDAETSQSEFKNDFGLAFRTTKNPRLGIVNNFISTD